MFFVTFLLHRSLLATPSHNNLHIFLSGDLHLEKANLYPASTHKSEMHICLYLEPCYIRDGHRSLGGGRDFYRSGMEIVVRIGLIRIGRLISKNNRCSFNHGRNSDVLLNISDQRMAFSFCTEWRLECIIYKESVSTTSAFEQKLVTVQIGMETEDRDIASEVGLQPSCCSDSTFTHINLAR